MDTGYHRSKIQAKQKSLQGKQFVPVLFVLLVVCILCVVFYLSGMAGNHSGSMESASFSADTRILLKKMEDIPPADPDSFLPTEEITEPLQLTWEDINALQAELLDHYGEYEFNSDKFRYWFEDAAIVGDSVAETISEFDWLYSQNLQAQIGISLQSCDEVIDGTVSLQPGTIFLVFSANNIASYGVGIDTYIEDYTAIIQKLKDSVPGADIYVEGILPCDPDFSEEYWYYDYMDDYNSAMQQMCRELDVNYFDSGFILYAHPDIYTEDGLHPYWQFYPLWLTYMARISGLAD